LPILADKKRKIKTVVLGIGNILLGDEGVGVHIVRKLQEMDFPSSILFIDGATAGFKLISLFEQYRESKFVIIDALMTDGDVQDRDIQPNHTEDLDIGHFSDRNIGKIYVIPLKDL
jgi:hydrogenase maturation protease